MHEYPPLRYHQATLDLLQAHPLVSAEAREALDELQRKYQLVLPASVREWYSLRDATEWLYEHSHDELVIPVQWLGAPERYWEDERLREQDLARQGLLPILVENQGVCTWAIQLNGAADPPVVISFEQTRPFTTWEPYAATFSVFVYTWIWDHQRLFSEHARLGDAPCAVEDLQFLRSHFTEEPQTVTYPTPITYRFSQGTARVLIWWNEAQTQWVLSATDAAPLEQLTETLESCGTLAQWLPAFTPFDQ